MSRLDRIEAREKILSTLPYCWYCGVDGVTPGRYACCSDECSTLLLRSCNQAWCDRVNTDELLEENHDPAE